GVRGAAERRAPALEAAEVRGGLSVVDQRAQVLAHGDDRVTRRWHLVVPGPEIGGAIRVGDDRPEPRLQRRADAAVGLEPARAGGQLEAAVERRDQPGALGAGDGGAEVPPAAPGIAGA